MAGKCGIQSILAVLLLPHRRCFTALFDYDGHVGADGHFLGVGLIHLVPMGRSNWGTHSAFSVLMAEKAAR